MDECTEFCLTCNINGCLTCEANKFYQTHLGTPFECVEICPDGYFGNTVTRNCEICGYRCVTCENTKFNCLSCAENRNADMPLCSCPL